ncbi:hypothetical protein [Archangium sp.]|uniref:hypothetical protein n=1 Tax=Archangium sp. TaxID=1872627 RepID=UPI002D65059D|nr:hypothetical protein [Archangium sp.]HYO56467.1 hypothetical protein [Archangium sp.]
MATRIRMGMLLLLGGRVVLASMGGWGLWKWGGPKHEPRPVEWPRAQPGEAGRAGSEEGAADEDPGDLGWDEDLGKEGYIVWRPKLGLQGPWTDGARPLTGGVKLLEEKLPLGLCHPSIQEFLVELIMESYIFEGVVRAIADNPELLEDILPRFKSGYFKTPEIDLYGPRDVKKGSRPVSSKSSNPPETAEVSVNMKVLTLCIGLSASACAAVQVRQVDTEWLEDCPKEARVAIEALGLGTGEPYDVGLLGIDYTRRQETPLFIKEGPLEARWEGLHLGPDFPRSELGRRMKGAKLFGRAKSYGHRMSVQFDRLKLADGRELPICAIGYDVWGKEPGLERWGPGSHPGVNVGNENPKKLAALKDLRPGEFPVANSTIWISFGMPFRPQWLSRR